MLHEKLKKMMASKKSIPDHEKDAKMDVVSHLRDLAQDAMKNKMGEMHKVAVASNSKEGLKHGLDKAKQVLSSEPSTPDHSDNSDMDNDDSMLNGSDDNMEMNEGGDVPEHETSSEEEQEMLHDAENPTHDALSAHEEHGDDEDMDEDELNSKLEKLMSLKKKKDAKKSKNPY